MATRKCLGRTEESQQEFIMVVALSCSCANLKTVLKVLSQLLENFHYHGSVRNAKRLNWTVLTGCCRHAAGKTRGLAINSDFVGRLSFPVFVSSRQNTKLIMTGAISRYDTLGQYSQGTRLHRAKAYWHCLRQADLKGQTSPAPEKSYHSRSVHLRLFIY